MEFITLTKFHGGKLVNVNAKKIVALEDMGRYSSVYLKHGEFNVVETLPVILAKMERVLEK